MEFTINIVLALLMPYRGKPYIPVSDQRKYRWVSLLPETAGEMKPDFLYVCLLTQAMERNQLVPGYHYVCIRNCYVDDETDAEHLSSYIVMDENRDVAWLFNLLHMRILELNQWEQRIQQALLQDCDYQRLLDESEDILKNALFVLDAAYRLLASSKQYLSPDPMNVSLLEKGYHTQETIQRFQVYGRFKEYHDQTGLLFGKAGEIARFETVSKWCRYGGVPLIHVVLVCSHNPLSAEMVELFEILMYYINICFLREQKQFQLPTQSYTRFMRDMLYHELTDVHQIAECAVRTNVPFSGNFNAYRIIFQDNAIVLVGRFVQELSSYLRESKIVANDYEISVLNTYPNSHIQELSALNINQIVPLLEQYGGICGISEPFHTLAEFKYACTQATRGLNFGNKLYQIGVSCGSAIKSTENTVEPGRAFRFEDIYVYYMIHLGGSGPFDVFKNTPYIQALKKLIAYDSERNSNLVEVLHCYLQVERRATVAGNLLHMHRNNVIYHVSRIEELLEVDLEDYWVRLGLMLAFHYLELERANEKETADREK